MLVKTLGIVFRSIKYGETSIITDIYTSELGLRTYIISGVRSSKSRISAGLLQVMSLVDLVVYHRDNKDMCRIKEIKAAHLFTDIPFNVRKGAVGLFMMEVMQKSIREREENKEIFDFLFKSLQFLDHSTDNIKNFPIAFMVKLSAYLGFQPAGRFSDNTPYFDLQEGLFTMLPSISTYNMKGEEAHLFSQFLKTDLENFHQLATNREQRNELLSSLINYYRFHIENMPPLKAHLILKTVLEG